MIKASLLSRALLVVTVFFTLVVVPAVPINSQMMKVKFIFAAYAAVTTTTLTDNISNATSSTNDTNISSEATTTITKPSLSTVLTKPPPSLEKEHEEIHKILDTIVESSGNTAAVAKQVRTLMQPHFEKERTIIYSCSWSTTSLC
jgi:cytoskeletal protein RodZ